MHRKMLHWNLIVVSFLLCIQIFEEVQSSSESHSNSHDLNHKGKVSSTTLRVFTNDNISNNLHGGDDDKVQTSIHVKHKPSNITDSKSDHDIVQTNVTTDGTRLRNNVESMNFGAVLRGFYVFLGLSVIVIMYFTVRAIRLGRKKTKVKKYGILANREDLEMTPLGVEDDEDDTTVFDLSNHPGQ